MEAPFNTTTARSPEMILASVNLYLDQYEPLRLVSFAIGLSTILFLFFPRLTNLAMTVILSVACANMIRAYQQDVETMDKNLSFWYSVQGFFGGAALVYFTMRTLF
jgi:hypothetical protein